MSTSCSYKIIFLLLFPLSSFPLVLSSPPLSSFSPLRSLSSHLPLLSSSPLTSHSLTIFQCGHLHPPVQDANLGPRRVKQLKEFTDYQILLLQFVLAQVLTRQGEEKGAEGEERGRRRERERKREGGREGRQEQREKGWVIAIHLDVCTVALTLSKTLVYFSIL